MDAPSLFCTPAKRAGSSYQMQHPPALASFVERKCKGSSGGFAGRASGRVDAGSFAYTARENASLAEWLATLLSAWLTRFAP